ncbi:MAG: spermidine/putrescine ABC transporter substrate-binding protein, partial [Actinomycetota bacterium]
MTKRPLSPEAAAVVAMSRSGLSRRRLLQVAGITGVAATAAACGAGSGGGGTASSSGAAPEPAPVQDLSDSEKFVNWANWPLYIDVNDETGAYPTLEAFT